MRPLRRGMMALATFSGYKKKLIKPVGGPDGRRLVVYL
jgi:hypothetical protein